MEHCLVQVDFVKRNLLQLDHAGLSIVALVSRLLLNLKAAFGVFEEAVGRLGLEPVFTLLHQLA